MVTTNKSNNKTNVSAKPIQLDVCSTMGTGKKSKRKKTKDKREYRKRVHFLNKINQVENKFNFIEQTNEEKA